MAFEDPNLTIPDIGYFSSGKTQIQEELSALLAASVCKPIQLIPNPSNLTRHTFLPGQNSTEPLSHHLPTQNPRSKTDKTEIKTFSLHRRPNFFGPKKNEANSSSEDDIESDTTPSPPPIQPKERTKSEYLRDRRAKIKEDEETLIVLIPQLEQQNLALGNEIKRARLELAFLKGKIREMETLSSCIKGLEKP